MPAWEPTPAFVPETQVSEALIAPHATENPSYGRKAPIRVRQVLLEVGDVGGAGDDEHVRRASEQPAHRHGRLKAGTLPYRMHAEWAIGDERPTKPASKPVLTAAIAAERAPDRLTDMGTAKSSGV